MESDPNSNLNYVLIGIMCIVVVTAAIGDINEKNVKKEKTHKNIIEKSINGTVTVKAIIEQTKIKKKYTITFTGKCSCRHYSNYKYHTRTWINYCPMCHKYGTLVKSIKQGHPEGIIICSRAYGGCDADYCIVHGTEHSSPPRAYLSPA